MSSPSQNRASANMSIFPSSGKYLTAVRKSAKELRQTADIKVYNRRQIDRLLSSPAFTSTFSRISKDHGLNLPLNFSSPLDELNFISILSLLNFASGYRVPLHAQTKRGAWDNIRALMFGMFITSSTGDGDLLSAKGMRTITVAQIAQFMNIDLHVERPHEGLPGVVIGELGGPLYQLTKLITNALNETGEILEKTQYPNLGAFVAEALKSTEDLNPASRADIVVERLVRVFPAFRDMSEVLGQPVFCFKKALFLVEAIAIRFGSLSTPPFPIPTTEMLPVFSDNVLPSMLIHLGVLDISSSPSLRGIFPDSRDPVSLERLLSAAPESGSRVMLSTPPKEGPVLTNDQAYLLRAAAIDACEMIVERAKTFTSSSEGEAGHNWIQSMSLPDLDMWLWGVAKDRPDYRALERFVARDTVYF